MKWQNAVLVIAGIIASIAIIYRVRLKLQGFTVTSWLRTPWHNDEVGGVANSKHLIGWAFDIVPGGSDTVKQKLRNMGFKTVFDEGNHVHVEIL